MKKSILFIALLMTTTLCMAKKQTAVFTTKPQMHCANCEKRMNFCLNLVKGVKEVEANFLDQTVRVVYNDKEVNEETLLKAFSAFGYKARVLKDGEEVEEREAHECKEMKKETQE